jgi:hypothetical protein
MLFAPSACHVLRAAWAPSSSGRQTKAGEPAVLARSSGRAVAFGDCLILPSEESSTTCVAWCTEAHDGEVF